MLSNLKSALKSNFFAKTPLVVLAFRCGSLVGLSLCLSVYINFSEKKILLHLFLPLGSLIAAFVFLTLENFSSYKETKLNEGPAV